MGGAAHLNGRDADLQTPEVAVTPDEPASGAPHGAIERTRVSERYHGLLVSEHGRADEVTLARNGLVARISASR